MASATNASSPSNFTASIIQDSHFSDEPAFLMAAHNFSPAGVASPFLARAMPTHMATSVLTNLRYDKSFANRLLEKLADNRHAPPNANFGDKGIYAVTLGGNVGMQGRKNAFQYPVKFRISPAVKDNQRLLRQRFERNCLHPRQWMT